MNVAVLPLKLDTKKLAMGVGGGNIDDGVKVPFKKNVVLTTLVVVESAA